MNKQLSLRWQITIITAILVIVTCLTLSYIISGTAIFYMDFMVSDLPAEIIEQEGEIQISFASSFSQSIEEHQQGYLEKNINNHNCNNLNK